MSIYSFLTLGIVAALFAALWLVNRFISCDQTAIRISNLLLLAASYGMVTIVDFRFALVLAAMTGSTWYFGKSRPKYGIVVAVLCLAYFKYTDFFAESFARLLGMDYTALNIILPVGISFYTFSAISYLADIARSKLTPAKFEEVALYLSFFPKLTSGPIQRSGDFFAQMRRRRNVGWESVSIGMQIFLFGLFKKIVLADRLSVFVNQVFGTPAMFGSFTIFLAVIGYSFQIYFDFSGYSDMAIGAARALDFHLPVNFNLPYLSHNVTELWKRWHITLSSWLQEYVYIGLGGNRKGRYRTYVNLIATMVLGGFWHGANWTYIVWGLLHGAALAVHKLWMSLTHSKQKHHSAFANVLSIVLTFLFVSFCWIFFRAESLTRALQILRLMFAMRHGVEQPYVWLFAGLGVYAVCCAAAAVRTRKNRTPSGAGNVCPVKGYYPILDLRKFGHLVIFFVFCGLLICLAYTGGSPFIYGRY